MKILVGSSAELSHCSRSTAAGYLRETSESDSVQSRQPEKRVDTSRERLTDAERERRFRKRIRRRAAYFEFRRDAGPIRERGGFRLQTGVIRLYCLILMGQWLSSIESLHFSIILLYWEILCILCTSYNNLQMETTVQRRFSKKMWSWLTTLVLIGSEYSWWTFVC